MKDFHLVVIDLKCIGSIGPSHKITPFLLTKNFNPSAIAFYKSICMNTLQSLRTPLWILPFNPCAKWT